MYVWTSLCILWNSWPMALTAEPLIPQFTLGDRLQVALDRAGVTVTEMALRLGVSRQTVGNYIAGRTNPKRAVIEVWADFTGVYAEWLLTGRDDMIPADRQLSLLASAY